MAYISPFSKSKRGRDEDDEEQEFTGYVSPFQDSVANEVGGYVSPFLTKDQRKRLLELKELEEEENIRSEWERGGEEEPEEDDGENPLVTGLSKALGFVGDVGEGIGRTAKRLTTGGARALGAGDESEGQKAATRSQEAAQARMLEALKDPKVPQERKDKLRQLLNEQNVEDVQAATESTAQIEEETNKRKYAGASGELASMFVGGPGIGQAFKAGGRAAAARAAGQTFAGGAGGGAGMALQEDEAGLEDVVKSGLLGGALGLGLAGGAAGAGAAREGLQNRAAAKRLVDFDPMAKTANRQMDDLTRSLDAEDAVVPADRQLGTGAERIQRELDELDTELDALRGSDPNTYATDPTDVTTLAGEPAGNPRLTKTGEPYKNTTAGTFAETRGATIADSSDTATRARTLMKQRAQLEQELKMVNGETPDPITNPSPPRGEAAQGPLSTPLKQPVSSNTPAGAVVTPEVPKTDIDLIREKLNEAFNSRTVQNTRRSRALGEKVRAATQASRGLKGAEADRAVLKQMKGALPKEEWNGLSDTLNVDEQTALFNRLHEQITNNPDLDFFQQRIRGPEALGKLIYGQGGVPQPNEIKLLGKVFGEEFAESLAVQARVFTKPNYASQILGAPKAMKATADLSMGFRQGAALGVRFPRAFKNSMKEQVKYLKNPKYYQAEMEAIGKRPNAELYKKMGIDLTGVDDFSVTEEQFMSTILEGKVSKKLGYGHVVAGSNRAFTGGLTRLRADAADSILDNLRRAGKLDAMTDVELKGLGDFINSASGRGKMYKVFERNGELLSNALFSPRLWASRLNMISPAYYKSLPPQARMLAVQTAGLYATAVGGVLALAKMGGAEVEMDPRSADFAKIKFGNTRYDIAGGFQQNIVFLARMLGGGVKSTSTGEISSLTDDTYGGRSRLSVIGDLFSNKANPLISALMVQISGEDRMGNDINRLTEAGKMGLPIGVENIGETYSEARDVQGKSGAQAALTSGLKAVPETFGIGTQTYGLNPLRGKQAELFEGQPREKQIALAGFLKQAKAIHQPTVRKKVDAAVADKQFERARRLATEYNLAMEDSLEELEAQTGPLPEEIRDYLRSNYQISYDYYARKGKKANR